MISFDYANVEEDYFRDGGGDGEGVREGGSLGGERGIWWELVGMGSGSWNWDSDGGSLVGRGEEIGWRRKLERGLDCISVIGR